MGYTNQNQILGSISSADLIGLTDDSGRGIVDNAILNTAIENASTDIDGLVANIYDTPFNPVPPAVANYCLAIVCYQLVRRRLIPDEKNIFYPQYKATIDFLSNVNKGEAHIPQTPPRSFPQGVVVGRATIYGGSPLSSSLSNSM